MAAPLAKKNLGTDSDSGLVQKILVDSITITRDGKMIYNCLEVLGNPSGDGFQIKRGFKCFDQLSSVLTNNQINKITDAAQAKMDLATSIDTYMTETNSTL